MSHREKSLTPWLRSPAEPVVPAATWDEATQRWSDDDPKTDEEKHLFCRRRTSVCATFIPQAMFDKATALGCDMRWYVPNRPMPITRGPGEVYINGKLAGTGGILTYTSNSLTRRGNPK